MKLLAYLALLCVSLVAACDEECVKQHLIEIALLDKRIANLEFVYDKIKVLISELDEPKVHDAIHNAFGEVLKTYAIHKFGHRYAAEHPAAVVWFREKEE